MEKCKGFLSVSERKAGWQISRCRTKIWHNRCKILHWKSYAVDPRLNCWICFQAFARTIAFDHSRIQKGKKIIRVEEFHDLSEHIMREISESFLSSGKVLSKFVPQMQNPSHGSDLCLERKECDCRQKEKLWCWILQVCRLNYIMLIVKLGVVGFE